MHEGRVCNTTLIVFSRQETWAICLLHHTFIHFQLCDSEYIILSIRSWEFRLYSHLATALFSLYVCLLSIFEKKIIILNLLEEITEENSSQIKLSFLFSTRLPCSSKLFLRSGPAHLVQLSKTVLGSLSFHSCGLRRQRDDLHTHLPFPQRLPILVGGEVPCLQISHLHLVKSNSRESLLWLNIALTLSSVQLEAFLEDRQIN